MPIVSVPSRSSSPLRPLPSSFVATRESLHRVAERIVAPARKPDNEIALEPAQGGFGTPSFRYQGRQHRVRVEGDELVHEVDGEERRAPLISIASAGGAVTELVPGEAQLDNEPLEVDRGASRALAAWYEFGQRALQTLIAEAKAEDDPSPPILWPEHFDLAIELGPEKPILIVGPNWVARDNLGCRLKAHFIMEVQRYTGIKLHTGPYCATMRIDHQGLAHLRKMCSV